MRIPCPYCGHRDSSEFSYLGDATTGRPDPGAAEDANRQTMHEYVYLRTNPAGPHSEHWYHASGCHAWLVVSRDTRTHEIGAVRFAGGNAK